MTTSESVTILWVTAGAIKSHIKMFLFLFKSLLLFLTLWRSLADACHRQQVTRCSPEWLTVLGNSQPSCRDSCGHKNTRAVKCQSVSRGKTYTLLCLMNLWFAIHCTFSGHTTLLLLHIALLESSSSRCMSITRTLYKLEWWWMQ